MKMYKFHQKSFPPSVRFLLIKFFIKSFTFCFLKKILQSFGFYKKLDIILEEFMKIVSNSVKPIQSLENEEMCILFQF